MNKEKVTNFVNTVRSTVSKHSPEILTGIGIAGMITTTVLAVKATPKALMLIEDTEYEKRGNLTSTEKVKICWKCYAPAAITGATSIACLVGANSVNAKRNAALATAYQISSTALSEYKEKVAETIGEKKEQIIKDNIAKDALEKNPVSKNEVIITGQGTTLCYDAAFGKYFESDIELIRKAVNTLNYKMLSEDYVSLNDFYIELGQNPIDIGDEVGWNISRDGMVEVNFSSQIADNGKPCIVLQYQVGPRYDYHKIG